MLTSFAGLCLVLSLFFPRFLVALPILGCLSLVLGALLRKERARLLAAMIGCAAVGVLVLSNMPADALSPPVDVTYEATGSARMASITMTNGQGGIEQYDVTLPWTQPMLGVRAGQFVSISVQSKEEYGDVTCKILANGVEYKSSTSSAAFGIADCSGRLP